MFIFNLFYSEIKEEFQKNFMDLMSNHLSALSKVRTQLSKERGTPESETILNILLKTFDLDLKFFDVSPMNPPNSSHAFFLWLLLHLLRVLGSERCRRLHPLTVKCVTGLYHLCSQKDIKLFSFIVREAVELLKSLSSVEANSVHFFKEESSTVALGHFHYTFPGKHREKMNLVLRPIELTSILDCAYFTSALLCILSELSTKINNYASSVESDVLRSIGVFMKHGGTVVKKSAVSTLRKLLSSGWSVQAYVVDTHISSAIALAEFAVKQTHKDHKGVLKGMEGELTDLFHWFFVCSNQARHHHWTRLSLYLYTTLKIREFENTSTETQQTLGTLIDAYVRCFASESSLVEFGRVSLGLLGKCHSLQLIVSPLVHLCEARQPSAPAPVEDQSLTLSNRTSDEPKPAKKLKTTKLNERGVSLSPSIGVTFAQRLRQETSGMVSKLLKMVQCKQKEAADIHLGENINWTEVLCLLEGIRVVMETHARLQADCRRVVPPKEVWWTAPQLGSLASMWEWVAAAAILRAPDLCVRMVLQCIYQSIGALYAAAVWGSLSLSSVIGEHLSSLLLLCWPNLLRKPWSGIVSGSKLPMDLRLQMLEQLKSSSVDLRGCKVESIHSLSIQPSTSFSLQSTEVLKFALFNSESSELKMTAIRTLPLWLTCEAAFHTQFVQWTRGLLEGFPQMSCDVAAALCSTIGAILVSVSLPGVACVRGTREWDVLVHRSTQVEPSAFTPVGSCSDIYDIVCGWVLEVAQLVQQSSRDGVKTALLSSVATIIRCMAEDVLTFKNMILKFLLSSSQTVLESMSKVMRCLIQGDSPSANGLVMDALTEAYHFHLTENSVKAREGIVNCFGQVGLYTDSCCLGEVVMAMIKLFEDPFSTVRATTAQQIKHVMHHHGYTASMLFDLVRVELSEYLAERIHSTPDVILSPHKQCPLVQQILELFSFDKQVTVLLEHTVQFLYPRLVYLSIKTPSKALDTVARVVGKNTKELLVLRMKYIFAYFTYTCSPSEFTLAVQFLEDVLKVNINQILEKDPVSVINELCVCVSIAPEQVKNGMFHVVRACHTESVSADTSRDQQIVLFMKPLLLGTLAVLNSKFLMASKQRNEKITSTVVESLFILMELMGPENITPLRVNVMGMLRLAIQEPSAKVVHSGLRAWSCFVRSLEKDSLGAHLCQVVVTLSPLVDQYPQEVADILTYLIVDNRAQLSAYFGEIYSLPNHPALEGVRKVFSEATVVSLSANTLAEKVGRILKGVANEQPAVRLDALEHLAKVLKENSKVLSELVTGHDSVAPMISELFTVLMRGSRDPDPDVRVRIGVCLGELGAVDPGNLGLSLKSDDTQPIRMYEIDGKDGEFAVSLLQELLRAFLAATTTRAQDCSAYAMQEVLKEYGCASHHSTSLGSIIWNKLSGESQAILQPFLSSQYNAEGRPKNKISIPIHRSGRKFIFKDWISKFTMVLIKKVQHERAARIFNACVYQFNHSLQIILFLFPHVLCSVITQDRDTGSKDPDLAHEVLVEVKNLASDMCSAGSGKERADELTHGCQTLFTALDHLQYWVELRTAANLPQKTTRGKASASANVLKDKNVEKVKKFLQDLPMDILARAAFACKAYARALRYMEDHLKGLEESSAKFQSTVGFLQNVYAALDEPDGVAGLSVLRMSEASLEEKVLELEMGGQYSEATSYYNMAIQSRKEEFSYFQGLLRCSMEMGQLTSVMMHVQGLQDQRPEWMRPLTGMRVEAAWRLGKWDDLEEILNHETSSGGWSVGLGRVLLAAKQKNGELFAKQLNIVRSEQMSPLSVASMEVGSYHRGYEYIVRLHMLQELEEGARTLLGLGTGEGGNSKRKLLEEWRARLAVTQTSYRTREPILSLRRLLYSLAEGDYQKELGWLWLESCGMARRGGLLETAGNSLRMAEVHALPDLYLERAKLLYAKGDTHQALLDLQKSIRDQWSQNTELAAKQDEAEVHAKALLYVGRWMEKTAHYDTQTILKQYKSVVAVCPQLESGHFYLAKYYERLMNLFASDKVKKTAEFLRFVLTEYGHALRYGNKYIYQSIPRLLTLWLDFGANVPDAPPTSSRAKAPDRVALQTTLASLNAIISDLSETLPPYHFLIAFSQLISRICHPNSDVFTHIQSIILNLIKHYPQQSLWMMMAVSKSTHKDRQTRCQRILTEAKKSNTGLEVLINDMMRLTERLLDVSNKKVDCQRPPVVVSMDKVCRSLYRLANDGNFSPIIVPIQSSLTVTLPLDGGGRYDDLNPFPGNQPTIVKFEDKVEVMASLVRPKKITILASDGQKYVMMCKPDDDLRKDSRLMEFYTLINKCLKKDPESRRRNLYIRTYSVVPLNEKCGLIEWVPNTSGLRHILNKIYQEKGIFMSGMDIKELWKNKMSDPLKLKVNFEEYVLPKFPPVFGHWFQRTFSDPTQWYSSRLAYSRTAAVMSIVGYVLGLGDRHGENVLFDSTNGDCIHVDFNCLFNRGKTFDVPECVPFRLTHNMVKAMGVTGYEGVFRRSCEVTMQVLREQCDPLMCVLKTFVHDPLVEWSKVKGPSESVHDRAMTIIKDIEDRMNGKGNLSKVPPLSIAGQVHMLIQDATSTDNLSKMYIGWAAYL
jgi:serine/threonine-protein kinase ATR